MLPNQPDRVDLPGEPERDPPTPGRSATWRRAVRPLFAAAIAAGVALALHASASLAATQATLEVMGFDPDRARLITDLIAAAIAVAAATLMTGAAVASAIAGAVAGGVLFGHTFVTETKAAIAAHGPAGVFDPGGWALTVLTLVAAFAIVAWATGSLAQIVRRALIAAGSDLAAFARRDRSARRVGRPAAIVAALVVLAATVPVFGDMVNFSPDARMLSGQTGLIGLTQSSSAADPETAGGNAGSTAQTGAAPTILAPGDGSATGVAHMIVKGGSPWAAWRPTGQGTVVDASLPAPWRGGLRTTASVQVYLPPGYTTSGRTYPVVYAVPWMLYNWTGGAHLVNVLDSMITSGQFPASIVVFVAQNNGPYATSECSNSADGREWFETYLTSTVVPYVDSTYRTISTAAARSILGFSQGGFCSTMLVLRHPNLFATAISLSGYYQAGILSSQTPNAYRVYGGNAALEAAYSPMRLVASLTPPQRSSTLLILEGDPADPFYGAQYTSMIDAAHAAGVAVAEVSSSAGHGWPTVRTLLPEALVILAQRQTALGVFS